MEENNMDIKLYNKLVKSISISELCLHSLAVNRKSPFQEDQQISVDLTFSTGEYELEDNKIIIVPRIKMELKNEKDSNTIAEINCSYLLEYESNLINDIDEVYLQFFVGNTVQSTIWPYMREIMGSLTSKMGYPPFVMPVYVRD